MCIWFLLYVMFVASYPVFFYPGSLVSKTVYKPFLETLETELYCSMSTSLRHSGTIPTAPGLIEYIEYNPFNITNTLLPRTFPPNSILIGHSFGAHAVLQQAKNNPNISVCVLLNGNFNHQQTLPYASTKFYDIGNISCLVIAGKNDRRLPFVHVLSDMYSSYQEQFNISYMITNDTHFSLFESPQKLATIIMFIIGKMSPGLRLFDIISGASGTSPTAPGSSLMNYTNNMIWKNLPPTRHYFGWWQFLPFLFAKVWTPDSINHMFHHPDGYVLYKTCGVDLPRYLQHQGYRVNLFEPRTKPSHNLRAALLQWLFGSIIPDAIGRRPSDDQINMKVMDVFAIHIPNTNTVYYKFKDLTY